MAQFLLAPKKYESKTTPSIDYFIGSCYAYVGDKARALKYFERVVTNKNSSQEGEKSQLWIQKLNRKLNVGVVFISPSNKGITEANFQNSIMSALSKNNLYNFVLMPETSSSLGADKSSTFQKFLEEQNKNNISVIIYLSQDYSTRKFAVGELGKGDVADQIRLQISSKIYSTKKKSLINSFEKVFENSSIINANINSISNQNISRYSRMLIPELISLGIL